MPKMKTKKSVAAKFKLTGSGQLKRGSCGRRHLLGPKTSKRKRQLRSPRLVTEAHLKTYKMLMRV